MIKPMRPLCPECDEKRLEQLRRSVSIEFCRKTLSFELHTDADLYHTWQSNIAMKIEEICGVGKANRNATAKQIIEMLFPADLYLEDKE